MPLREYRRTEVDLDVTSEMLNDFKDAGYVMVRNMLDKEEVSQLKKSFETIAEYEKHSFAINDGAQAKIYQCCWNFPGNDVSGMVARSEKYAGTCEKLMGGEVYHYHSKVMKKEAQSGGRIVWHQDYGYWYKSGNLFPDMINIFTAIDPCTRENGCLQILEGSHQCGRIDHGPIGGQVGADVERVEQLKTKLEHHYVEMEPGDAIIFHCNLLHVSSANTSIHRRWAFANAYNMASNSSVVAHHHPSYHKLQKVANTAIKDCTSTDTEGKAFLDNTKADWYDPEAEQDNA
ncbi:hypothetical protein ACOMHN_016637 [Nucella lapillus]